MNSTHGKPHRPADSRSVHPHTEYDYSKFVYTGAHVHGIIACPILGHGDFRQTPNNHLRGNGCPKCSGNQLTAHEDFILQAKVVHHNEKYDYSKFVYINAHSSGLIICAVPGHGDFKQTPAHHIRGQGCPKCGHVSTGTKRRKAPRDFLVEARITHPSENYDYSKFIYINYLTLGTIICPIPKHGEFKQSPANHLRGQGCPVCKSSKGELAILGWLAGFKTDGGLTFKRQHRIPACRDVNPLPFDFIVTVSGQDYLVEFHGRDHYEAVQRGERTDEENRYALFDRRWKDRIKHDYCKRHSISFLAIPYWDTDRIPELLSAFLGVAA